jgi:hypothetical protein
MIDSTDTDMHEAQPRGGISDRHETAPGSPLGRVLRDGDGLRGVPP